MNELDYRVKLLKSYFISIYKLVKKDNSRGIGITLVGLERIIKEIEEIENLCKQVVIKMPCGRGKRKKQLLIGSFTGRIKLVHSSICRGAYKVP